MIPSRVVAFHSFGYEEHHRAREFSLQASARVDNMVGEESIWREGRVRMRNQVSIT